MSEGEIKNVVVVMIDTLRRDHVGVYGNEWIKTPNLDTFGNRGIVFDNAVVGSFACIPCRHDCWTGHYNFLNTPWRGLNAEEEEFSRLLDEAGHRSMLISDQGHMFTEAAPDSDLARRIGYAFVGNFHRNFTGWDFIRGQVHDPWRTQPIDDVPLPCQPEKIKYLNSFRQHQRNTAGRTKEEDYFPARVFRSAADWIEENHTQDGFCLWVDCFDPHEPWDPPSYYADLYDSGYRGEQIQYPPYGPTDFMSSDEQKHMRALYAGEVTMVDRWFGFFMEKMEYLHLLDRTLVIVTADHGHMLGEHGLVGKPPNTLYYPEVARTPLLVWDPRRSGQGRREHALVQALDLFPTILESLQVDVPTGTHGLSLLPRLADPSQDWRETAIFGQHGLSIHVFDGRWQLGLPLQPKAGKECVLFDYDSGAPCTNLITDENGVRKRLANALREQMRAARAPDALRAQVDGILRNAALLQ